MDRIEQLEKRVEAEKEILKELKAKLRRAKRDAKSKAARNKRKVVKAIKSEKAKKEKSEKRKAKKAKHLFFFLYSALKILGDAKASTAFFAFKKEKITTQNLGSLFISCSLTKLLKFSKHRSDLPFNVQK